MGPKVWCDPREGPGLSADGFAQQKLVLVVYFHGLECGRGMLDSSRSLFSLDATAADHVRGTALNQLLIAGLSFNLLSSG